MEGVKNKFPEALLLVHPECSPEVIDIADEVLSTSGMIKFAKSSSAKSFLIGTEEVDQGLSNIMQNAIKPMCDRVIEVLKEYSVTVRNRGN